MTNSQRNAMRASTAFTQKETNEAMGLQIFNTSTKCVETWNGTTWIQQCPPEGPAVFPISPSVPQNCTVEAGEDNMTFTAMTDPNAVAYEFFLNGVSQGEQSSKSITFTTEQSLDNVTVQYFYPPAFLKPTMIAVQGGTFTLGEAVQAAADGMSGNEAVANSHLVTLSDFSISETPVTQAQFEAVMGVNPAHFVCSTDIDYFPSSAKPVENVSWYYAIAYCNKLSIQERKALVYSVKIDDKEIDWAKLKLSDIPKDHVDWNATQNLSANGYRLPTEAEWEYAARGGQLSEIPSSYYSGSNTANDVAWHAGNNGSNGTATYGTKAVKQKQPNALGLYDMSGNVVEWCWDRHYDYTAGAVINPVGPVDPNVTVTTRVLRGGYWSGAASSARVNYHQSNGNPYAVGSSNHAYGFRVVCSAVE